MKAIELDPAFALEIARRSMWNTRLTDLRLNWDWDRLRGIPRFQKILAGLEPKTVY